MVVQVELGGSSASVLYGGMKLFSYRFDPSLLDDSGDEFHGKEISSICYVRVEYRHPICIAVTFS